MSIVSRVFACTIASSFFFVACTSEEDSAPVADIAAPVEGSGPAADAAGGSGPAAAPAAPAAPAGNVGKVEAVAGAPKIVRGSETLEGKVDVYVMPGDKLVTGDADKIRIKMSDDSLLALGPKSELVLTELKLEGGRQGKLDVLLGKFWMQVAKWNKEGESYVEVRVPNAVAGIRGTTLWGDTERDVICSLDGEVEVKSSKVAPAKAKKKGKAKAADAPTTLTAGNCAAEMGKGKTKPLKPKAEDVQKYLDEVQIK